MSRVSTETMTVGILSLLFALVGAFLLRQYLREDVSPPPARRTRVPLVANDLPANKVVAMGDVVITLMTDQEMRDRNWQLDFVMTDPRQIIGRVLSEPMESGEPFLINKFRPVGLRPSLADRLKPGYRAVTIEVTQTQSVGGFVGPTDLVDVIFLPNDRADDDIPRTTFTLLEAVEVLATDANMQPDTVDGGDPETVTLAVTPEQSHKIQLVRGYGTLSLSLRNPNEPLVTINRRVHTIEDALGIQRAREPQAIPPFQTEIFRGGARNVNAWPRMGQIARNDQYVIPSPTVQEYEQQQMMTGDPFANLGSLVDRLKEFDETNEREAPLRNRAPRQDDRGRDEEYQRPYKPKPRDEVIEPADKPSDLTTVKHDPTRQRPRANENNGQYNDANHQGDQRQPNYGARREDSYDPNRFGGNYGNPGGTYGNGRVNTGGGTGYGNGFGGASVSPGQYNNNGPVNTGIGTGYGNGFGGASISPGQYNNNGNFGNGFGNGFGAVMNGQFRSAQSHFETLPPIGRGGN